MKFLSNKTKKYMYDFFENPRGFWQNLIQIIIFILIFVSVGMVWVELSNHKFFLQYETAFHIANHIILGIFTIEYIVRLICAPKKWQFIRKPMNIVDFFAIAPNYVELFLPFFIDTTELRVLRLIRLLRFTRMLRLLKVFKYGNLFKKIFQFQETILEAIFPIIIFFIGFKAVFWFLESHGWWLSSQDLGNLFAIIGFALGIILSQKIGVSYDKFVQVEEASIRLYSSLWTLTEILESFKPKAGIVCRQWAKAFLELLLEPKSNNHDIVKANAILYKAVVKIERTPSDITMLQAEIAKDAAFCLSKKVRLTPQAYDTLLHQATMLYLALIAAFIPGLTGVISVVIGTYILYGMYHLTQDLDSIIGGEFNLINIDISELQDFAQNSR